MPKGGTERYPDFDPTPESGTTSGSYKSPTGVSADNSEGHVSQNSDGYSQSKKA